MGRITRPRLALLVVAVLAAGCGAAADPPGAGADAAPAAPPRTFGGDRPVKLQVPRNLDPGTQYPLLLMLHGYGAAAIFQQAYLQLSNVDEVPGAFALAPDGTLDSSGKRFWNASDACCNFDGKDVDDVAYLSGLIADVSAAWPIDPNKVFVVGHSNGSFMALRLACERADLIAAIAGLAGASPTMDPAGCPASRPVSVLHIHGTADESIAYAGSPIDHAAPYPGAVDTVAQWGHHNGCSGHAAVGTLDLDSGLPGEETDVDAYSGCPPGGAAELWTINGGDHLPDLAPDFGQRLWAWLDDHARP